MNLIVCVSNNMGYMFNNRRLSSDVFVINDILAEVKDKKLICSEYSSKLFINKGFSIEIDNNIVEDNSNDYYFLENIPINNFIKYKKVIIYCWNRDYPSDIKFNYNLDNYENTEYLDFIGNSHEKITKKIYIRKDLL